MNIRNFGGKVLFLDRADINTDEIIPAKYLTEISKEALRDHLLEDLRLPGFDPKSTQTRNVSIIVTRENFGCGSSREHAVWALEVNGISAVIAPSFARIFRQNMFNCGMMAIEVSQKVINELFSHSNEKDVTIKVDVETDKFMLNSPSSSASYSYNISEYDKNLVLAGGWLEYADGRY